MLVLKGILASMFSSSLEVCVYAASTALAGISGTDESRVELITSACRVPLARVLLSRALQRIRVRGLDATHLLIDLGACGDEVMPSVLAAKLDWREEGEGTHTELRGSFEKRWAEASAGVAGIESRAADAVKGRPEGWDARVLMQAMQRASPTRRLLTGRTTRARLQTPRE